MNRHKSNIIVFLAVFACFMVLLTVFPADIRTIERENRALNPIPQPTPQSLLSGEFADGLESYLSDRVGFRASVVDVSQAIEKTRGFAPGGVRVTNNTLVLPDRMLEIFTSNKWVQINYTEAVTSYLDVLPEGTRVFSMLVPTPIEFQEPRYKAVSDSELDAVNMVYGILESAGIATVDVYSTIEAHAGEYIFFRTDHHWTMLGAYYAYLKYAEAAGIEPVDIADCTQNRTAEFRGFLYNRVPYSNIEPDYIVWYENPWLETSRPLFYVPGEYDTVTYGIFLEGDQAEYAVETNAESGKTAVILKDSYANPLVPWLAAHYDRIIAVDPRTFTGSVTEIASRYEQVDFIFVTGVPTTTYIDFIAKMNDVR